MNAPPRIAIIGGGWAGLAAAVELTTEGVQVVLFESSRQLGGRARSVKLRDHPLDNGQHILVGAYRNTLDLMRRVGADPDTLLRRLPLELSFPGSNPKPFRLRLPCLPAPLHLAIGLFTAQGTSFKEKINAARFMHRLQACDYRLPADCTVSEMLDRNAQQGSLRRHLWEPLCLAALNTSPAAASAQIFANVLRDSLGGSRADTDLLLPAADLDQIFPHPAADFIRRHDGDIRLSTRIDGIDENLSVAGEVFDQVIIACAPQHAAPLLARHPATAALAAQLAGYAYEPIGTVYVGYPPETRLPFPMLGLDASSAKKNQSGLGQWVFDRGALCGTNGIMAFVLSAQGAWDKRNSETLSAALHIELENTLGKKLPQPIWHKTVRERRATFSCCPDLPRPAARSARHGLWIAGDYACADYPATLEGAIRSGLAAARGALANHAATHATSLLPPPGSTKTT